MTTYTAADLAKARKHGDVTRNGVAFDWWLANMNGAGFCLYREPHHTDADIKLAEHHIRNDRDVVGRIRIATLEGGQ